GATVWCAPQTYRGHDERSAGQRGGAVTTTELFLEGLAFGEGPRWHDGRLWFSDFYRHAVFAADEDGKVEEIVQVADQPSGLGWLPDGRLLVVSMVDRKVLRMEGPSLVEHADL